MAYGNKRDYPKIDIQQKRKDGRWYYICSSTWSPTCEEAIDEFMKRASIAKKENIRAAFKDTPQSVAGRHPSGTET